MTTIILYYGQSLEVFNDYLTTSFGYNRLLFL